MGSIFNDWISLRLVNILALIVVAVATHFWPRIAQTEHNFFERIPWNIWAATASLALIYVLSILVFIAEKYGKNWIVNVLIGFGAEVSTIIVLVFFFRFFNRSPNIWLHSSQSAVYLILIGLKWVLCTEIVFHLALSFLPERILLKQFQSSAPFQEATKFYGANFGVLLLIASYVRIMVASVLEEVTFRGLLYSALRKQISYRPAIVISSVLFMLMHGLFDPISFALGCILASLYETYKSILPSVVAHVTWNLLAVTYSWTGIALSVNPSVHHRFVALAGFLILSLIYSILWLAKKNGLKHTE